MGVSGWGEHEIMQREDKEMRDSGYHNVKAKGEGLKDHCKIGKGRKHDWFGFRLSNPDYNYSY